MTFALDRAFRGELRHSWGWYVALGIILLVLGIIALGSAGITTFATVVTFGWLLMIGGVVLGIHSFTIRRWSGFFLNLLMGILYFIVGLLLVAHPAAGAVSLTLILAAFFMVAGIFRIGAGIAIPFPHRAWLIFNGIVTLVLGILVWAQWPSSSIWLIGTFIGIELVLYGWSTLMLGIMAHHLPPEQTA